MKFSFLDISITSPKDLYSLSRIKSTVLFNWYGLWRLALLSPFVIAIVAICVGFFIQGNIKESINTIQLHLLNPWVQSISTIVFTFIISLLSYSALYRKKYRSFKLTLNTDTPICFWSWYFWKRYSLFTLTSLPFYLYKENVSMLIKILIYGVFLLLSHFCLHCGFWGVRHESKHFHKQATAKPSDAS